MQKGLKSNILLFKVEVKNQNSHIDRRNMFRWSAYYVVFAFIIFSVPTARSVGFASAGPQALIEKSHDVEDAELPSESDVPTSSPCDAPAETPTEIPVETPNETHKKVGKYGFDDDSIFENVLDEDQAAFKLRFDRDGDLPAGARKKLRRPPKQA